MEQNKNGKTKNKICNPTEQKSEPLEGPDGQREPMRLQRTQSWLPARPTRARTGIGWDVLSFQPCFREHVGSKLLGEQGQPPLYICYRYSLSFSSLENGAPVMEHTHQKSKQTETVRFPFLSTGDF